MRGVKKFMAISLSVTLALGAVGISGEAEESAAASEAQSASETAEENAAQSAETEGESVAQESEETVMTTLSKIDGTKWNYNEEDNVYWQVGISYCANPAAEEYETLGLFIPGDYLTATANGDGTYTCEMNTEAVVGGYTAENAPIVIPVNTPGYSAMAAPTGYVEEAADYTDAGFLYVYAGCRGRDAGAPAGVADLKAAIRYIRYNSGNIPGNTDRIFSFGMSGGGAQSALLGAAGNSALYTPYLEAIGAVEGVSDAVAGAMCWCPITSLDYANEAYEWNLGVSRTGLDEEMKQLSDGMAEAFAEYINELGLTDGNGNVLSLVESEDGIYQAGSYYEYLKTVIEDSLNQFLANATFPYEVQRSGGTGERRMLGDLTEGELPEEDLADGELPDGELAEGDLTDGELLEGDLSDGELSDGELAEGDLPDGELPDEGLLEEDFEENQEEDAEAAQYQDNVTRMETQTGLNLSGTYETVQDYIDALNAETAWVSYDSETNTATITSIADFVKALKPATKSVGAFDDLNAAQVENMLFGYNDGYGAHFDAVMAELLAENEAYGNAYEEDLQRLDSLGNTVEYRMNMYNPMYYLNDYYKGYQTANVAKYWRIRTGINQGDTALTTEVNLALALQEYGATVDFETIWGQGHVEAECEGDSTTNFITWVNNCLNTTAQ